METKIENIKKEISKKEKELYELQKQLTRLIKKNCIMTLKELLDSLSFDEIAPYLIRHYTYDYAPGDFFVDLLPKIFCPRLDNTLGKEIRIDVAYYE